MYIDQFKLLNDFEKLKATNAFGSFVAERRSGGDRFYLFVLNHFYIELFHGLSNLNNKGITVYRVFDDPKYLDAYLEEIDISSIAGDEQ